MAHNPPCVWPQVIEHAKSLNGEGEPRFLSAKPIKGLAESFICEVSYSHGGVELDVWTFEPGLLHAKSLVQVAEDPQVELKERLIGEDIQEKHPRDEPTKSLERHVKGRDIQTELIEVVRIGRNILDGEWRLERNVWWLFEAVERSQAISELQFDAPGIVEGLIR